MVGWNRYRLLASMLWGAVAAAGEYTALFLTIIRRIHVGFANSAPVFRVDPSGPITLTKNSALASVWVLTVLYGLLVAGVAYSRRRPTRATWLVIAIATLVLTTVAALADPWWGLIVLADLAAICSVWLIRRSTTHQP